MTEEKDKHRIAIAVENILVEYPKSREQFKKQIAAFNLYFRKYWECAKNKPVPYESPTGENIKAGYEYDPDFKICFPVENAEIPNPTFWEIADKSPCYYATLAVLYDLLKGKDAPFLLCTDVLDKRAFGFVKMFLKTSCKDRLNTAIKWVKNDLDTDNKTLTQLTWDDPAYILESEALKLDGRISLPRLSKLLKSGKSNIRYQKRGNNCKVHIQDFKEYMKTFVIKTDFFSEEGMNALAKNALEIEERKEKIRQKKGKTGK